MFYIPKDWYKDKSNEPIVQELVKKYLYTDLVCKENEGNFGVAISELEKIGETLVAEKLEKGELKLPA